MVPACAAKAGIDAMTRTLALEWARFGIRVNAIAPGPIITEGVQKAFQLGGDFAQFADTIPLRRAGEPEEIGNMAVYLASGAASWITGQVFVVDGGESLSPRRAGIDPDALDNMVELMAQQRKG
jgi:peroxisomal 2,4-dienoyl-CoA reductase